MKKKSILDEDFARHMAETIGAFCDGVPIEFRAIGTDRWYETAATPHAWDWTANEYRAKEAVADIPWACLRKDVLYIAADEDGAIYAFSSKPYKDDALGSFSGDCLGCVDPDIFKISIPDTPWRYAKPYKRPDDV